MPCLFISLAYFVCTCIPYVSHKFTAFCLNLRNLREIMSYMPRKGKERGGGAIVHEVFENVTPGHGNCVIKTHENVTIGNVRGKGNSHW